MSEDKSPEEWEAGDHITTLLKVRKDNEERQASNPQGVCGEHTRTVQNQNAITGALAWLIRRKEGAASSVLVFKKGLLTGLPVKYVLYAACLTLCLCAWLVDRALTNGKLNELAEAVNTVRGTASMTAPNDPLGPIPNANTGIASVHE